MVNCLGRLGIDVIRITGFTSCKKFVEPVIRHLVKDDKIIKFLELGNADIKNNAVCIYGDFYRFRWGNHVGRAFAYMEIHAKDATGNNLYNMSMDDVKRKLNDAIVDLWEKYKINFKNCEWEHLRITYAEINRTFQMQRPFCVYSDFLKLMGRILRKKYRMKSSAVYTSDSEDESKLIDECLYLIRGKKNFELKIYDKGKEMRQKKVLSKNDNRNYLRIELTLKKESELKSNGAKAFLMDITDADMYHLYLIKINKMITGCDAYFKRNLFEGSDTYSAVDQILMDNLLQYGINHDYSYDGFLKDLLIIEAKSQKLILSGINDMRYVIDNIKYIKDKDKCFQLLEEACKSNFKYQSILERDSIYYELKQMLLS